MRQRIGVLYVVVLAVIVVCAGLGAIVNGFHGLSVGAGIGSGLGIVISLVSAFLFRSRQGTRSTRSTAPAQFNPSRWTSAKVGAVSLPKIVAASSANGAPTKALGSLLGPDARETFGTITLDYKNSTMRLGGWSADRSRKNQCPTRRLANEQREQGMASGRGRRCA